MYFKEPWLRYVFLNIPGLNLIVESERKLNFKQHIASFIHFPYVLEKFNAHCPSRAFKLLFIYYDYFFF